MLRESIAEADSALKLSLSGEETRVVAETASSQIPVIGQAVLGFVLPWILAMVAIPLEMLLDSGRHVRGADPGPRTARRRCARPRGRARGDDARGDVGRGVRDLREHPAQARAHGARAHRGARAAATAAIRGTLGPRTRGWPPLCLLRRAELLAGPRRPDRRIRHLRRREGGHGADQARNPTPTSCPATRSRRAHRQRELRHANVEAIVTLDQRPSHANAQKLELARRLDDFAARDVRASYTDIHGAIMLASEYLQRDAARTAGSSCSATWKRPAARVKCGAPRPNSTEPASSR